MIHKKTLNVRIIFSVMVPVSVIAFIIGSYTVSIPLDHFSIFDGVGNLDMMFFSLDLEL